MDVMGVTSNLTLYLLLTVAVAQDMRQLRISNRLILAGMAAGILFHIPGAGIEDFVQILLGIIFPVISLYLFYLMGVIGPGDIKLFSIISLFMNLRELTCCMILSFFLGAIVGVFKLIVSGEMKTKLLGAVLYLADISRGNIHEYRSCGDRIVIHFSVEIMAAVIIIQILNLLQGGRL